MHINYTLVALATLAQFILGAVWYSPLMFGRWWMEIMEVTKIAQKNLKKLQQEMMPFYIMQLVLTAMATLVLALFSGYVTLMSSENSVYLIAGLLWSGIIVPTQIASVIWGKTKKKFWLRQILVMTLNQLVSIMIASLILSQ
jgi:hypothetical protein